MESQYMLCQVTGCYGTQWLLCKVTGSYGKSLVAIKVIDCSGKLGFLWKSMVVIES
jgi:hypothetical protein